MGKMKELFMKIYYPEWDLEREHLINDSLARDREYEEYIALLQDPTIHNEQTKIEVKDGETRIEVHQEKQQIDSSSKITENGF